MFIYNSILFIAKLILYIFNGKPEVYGLENLPEDRNVILASTHRSNWDPFIIANIIKPRLLAFMAKESLFDIPVFGKAMIEAGMIPVNREKRAVKRLNQQFQCWKKENETLVFSLPEQDTLPKSKVELPSSNV